MRSARLAMLSALTLALPLGVAACGRHATHADCQLIVDRSVELRMKANSETDPTAVAKREAAVRTELDDRIKSCERDRRVTDKMMSCVQSAPTIEELEECLH